MSAHVTAVVKACFAALRQIRSVRRSITRTTLLTLVHALVLTKVDYCSSVLSGISGQLLQRLQSVCTSARTKSAIYDCLVGLCCLAGRRRDVLGRYGSLQRDEPRETSSHHQTARQSCQ